ncbi:retrovirus-related Pol polyprotein from transposon TNT 1-94 [Pyrus ussuriensis x Pyrus communis]|uniref:Retrovirus-related Pol polyprotein from transposon TNT 1-94 n=1 Tax=Pyrus ussuriensis x Pyrus communis TaxID=2448454 RepID=A0A5N5FS44_9ROSA|nr:retrovirus-related Pol polyprotein from transposon TNT 1-94 [Pyrus ussuriensis x Pyrus communis]
MMAGSGSSEVRTPIFSSENYEFWKIKMMTVFKSQGLWKLVEKKITLPDDSKKKKKEVDEVETVDEDDELTAAMFIKDAKALGFIQNAVSDQIFPQIANADSSKMAWDLLYGEYHGGDQVRSVKPQNLRHEFEYARMRDDESLSSYLTCLNEMINQMKTFGETLSNERLVQKVLISLSKAYDLIRLVIENTKCLETVELQEVLAILKSQKQHFDLHSSDVTKKAFASLSVGSNGQNKNNSQSSGYQAQKSWNSRGNAGLLVDIRTNVAGKVQMPTGVLVNVIGMRSLAIDTNKGKKYIREVMHLPGLKENLLSVGQMDEHGYYLLFEGAMCSVFDGPLMDNLIIKVKMKENRCYLLSVLRNNQLVLKASIDHSTRTWHRRLGHLNFKGLQQLREKDTVHRLPYLEETKENGVVERKNRTLVEMAKTMLHDRGMPYFLWAEAMHTAVYILNRCPTKALGNITPFEAYIGRKPGIAHLKIFGSLCYVHVPIELRQKLDAKSTKGVFVGYETCEKGYRVLDPISKKLILSRDVVFDEEASWNWKENPQQSMQMVETSRSETPPSSHVSVSPHEENIWSTDSSYISTQSLSGESSKSIRKVERSTQAYDHTPLKWRNFHDILAQCNMCVMEPERYADAAQDESWLKAMQDELTIIEKNDTWELMDKPTMQPVIGVKWVYKTKLNLDDTVLKNKARLVAKGYAQKLSLDYNETYAPVARLDTIKTLIALAVQKELEVVSA